MFPKEKPIRLHGAALRKLNHAIHERDGHSCIVCHRWVDDGEKFHHYPFGNGVKGDEINKGVTLCLSCHGKAHGTERNAPPMPTSVRPTLRSCIADDLFSEQGNSTCI